ncbi:guanylate kinase [Pseudoflavitalea sp. X16]|uniref:guanylate kinase n=1 Tax=Paraflavitalea devenefica TaxID=2716334 RepID=UPI00141FA4C7|nr:guanylate kinase [Paraflavitalea devenefica]NII24733.1 guanylate kinase [Paraflavitalea devenefica]
MSFNPGNKILIITAPSGAGKTSITRHLLQHFPQLAFSVSAATREARGNEKDGADYYFMSVEDFQQKIRDQQFVEWEMVYEGKYYGTLKSELDRIWANNQVPVLDIDVKGAIHVQQQYPNTTLSVFIEPPSVDELKRRLESRGTETAESLQARVNKASYEISFKHHFHRIVVNAQLDKAREEAMGIVRDFLEI